MVARGATRSRLAVVAVFGAAVSVGVAGCNTSISSTHNAAGDHAAANQGSHPADDTTSTGASTNGPPVGSVARLTTNIKDGAADVTVDTPVTVRASDGKLDSVVVSAGSTTIPGSFNDNKTVWTASDLLEPGTTYAVRSKATGAAGKLTHSSSSFRTQDLSLDQQTYAKIMPVQGQTVGVGMPIMVTFDVPVTDHAAFERHMTVTSTPSKVGTWHWVNDNEVHWRPRVYWQSGTHVAVHVDVNGVNAGNGIYGQMNRDVNFTVGSSVIIKADLKTDKMGVYLNGKLARTIPITGGKSGGYETRSGINVIEEKYTNIAMDAATVGISPGSSDYYNIPDVKYAQRITDSGEFLHAAPWSVYAQGHQNVSHGCVGMSTANAEWLFGKTHIGDPVEVAGTSRPQDAGNGWTDWNESWQQYQAGSALR
ncbi:MAG: L,D-transpeptidase [Nocardioidaceae bacterium]